MTGSLQLHCSIHRSAASKVEVLAARDDALQAANDLKRLRQELDGTRKDLVEARQEITALRNQLSQVKQEAKDKATAQSIKMFDLQTGSRRLKQELDEVKERLQQSEAEAEAKQTELDEERAKHAKLIRDDAGRVQDSFYVRDHPDELHKRRRTVISSATTTTTRSGTTSTASQDPNQESLARTRSTWAGALQPASKEIDSSPAQKLESPRKMGIGKRIKQMFQMKPKKHIQQEGSNRGHATTDDNYDDDDLHHDEENRRISAESKSSFSNRRRLARTQDDLLCNDLTQEVQSLRQHVDGDKSGVIADEDYDDEEDEDDTSSEDYSDEDDDDDNSSDDEDHHHHHHDGSTGSYNDEEGDLTQVATEIKSSFSSRRRPARTEEDLTQQVQQSLQQQWTGSKSPPGHK